MCALVGILCEIIYRLSPSVLKQELRIVTFTSIEVSNKFGHFAMT